MQDETRHVAGSLSEYTPRCSRCCSLRLASAMITLNPQARGMKHVKYCCKVHCKRSNAEYRMVLLPLQSELHRKRFVQGLANFSREPCKRNLPRSRLLVSNKVGHDHWRNKTCFDVTKVEALTQFQRGREGNMCAVCKVPF